LRRKEKLIENWELKNGTLQRPGKVGRGFEKQEQEAA
jgi:hypothetical protein